MKATLLWALIVLNAVLFISFIARVGAPNAAIAQAQVRRPGEYAMIPGRVTGGTSGVVYVIDTTNGLLTAMTYDQSAGQARLASLPQINLAELFARGAGPATPPEKKTGRNGR